MNTTSQRRWKFVFWAGIATFGIGASAGLMAERSEVDAFAFAFLGGLLLGSLAFLVASVALALLGKSSSAIAGGSASLFLAFFVPMAFEHWGGSVSPHDSAGASIMLFAMVAGLAGLLVLAIGIVRMASSPE